MAAADPDDDWWWWSRWWLTVSSISRLCASSSPPSSSSSSPSCSTTTGSTGSSSWSAESSGHSPSPCKLFRHRGKLPWIVYRMPWIDSEYSENTRDFKQNSAENMKASSPGKVEYSEMHCETIVTWSNLTKQFPMQMLLLLVSKIQPSGCSSSVLALCNWPFFVLESIIIGCVWLKHFWFLNGCHHQVWKVFFWFPSRLQPVTTRVSYYMMAVNEK